MGQKGPFFLIVEFQVINVEGNREIEDHHYTNITIVTVVNKIHQWMQKKVWKLKEKQDLHGLRVSLPSMY